MSDKLPSRVQTLPLKDTRGDLELQNFRFFIVHTPEKITWISFVPEPAESELQHKELTEGMTTKYVALLFTEQHLPDVRGKYPID